MEIPKPWFGDRSSGVRLTRKMVGRQEITHVDLQSLLAWPSKNSITSKPFSLHPLFLLNRPNWGFTDPVLLVHGVFCPFFFYPFQIWPVIFISSSFHRCCSFSVLLLHMWNMLSDPKVYMCTFRVGSLWRAESSTYWLSRFLVEYVLVLLFFLHRISYEPTFKFRLHRFICTHE